MSFISVLLAYLLSRYTGVSAWLHRDGWFAALLDLAAGGKTQTLRPFLLVPVAGSLLLALLLGYLPFWTAFFCGLLLLLFSTGRGSWRADITSLPAQLQAGKAGTVWLALQDEGMASAAEGERRDGFWHGWCRHASIIYLDKLFAVFFWFFLLGPAGAVFYRLVSLYHDLPVVREGRLPAQRGWLLALLWLPARYMALCSCLAGNFTTAFDVWRRLLLDTRLSPAEYLARCLDAALINEGEASVPAEADEALRLALQRHPALQDLLARTEIIGLVGLSLAILLLH